MLEYLQPVIAVICHNEAVLIVHTHIRFRAEDCMLACIILNDLNQSIGFPQIKHPHIGCIGSYYHHTRSTHTHRVRLSAHLDFMQKLRAIRAVHTHSARKPISNQCTSRALIGQHAHHDIGMFKGVGMMIFGMILISKLAQKQTLGVKNLDAMVVFLAYVQLAGLIA